jgi:hypothetical protein
MRLDAAGDFLEPVFRVAAVRQGGAANNARNRDPPWRRVDGN